METAIGYRDIQSTEPLSLSVSRQSLLTATANSPALYPASLFYAHAATTVAVRALLLRRREERCKAISIWRR